MKNESIDLLAELSAKLNINANINITDAQLSQFNTLGDMLIEWNQKVNLTAIVDERDIIIKHFIDSLSIIKHVKPGKYIDVGSGAGFPGLPVKIILGGAIDTSLIEAAGKKVRFINSAISALGLASIETVHIRAEDAGHLEKYRESADVVTARAVAALPTLLEYCTPFLKQGGVFVAMKSSSKEAEEEACASGGAASLLGCRIEGAERFALPGSDIGRAAVIVRKVSKTPAKYPRKAGLPSKRPLYA